jgi:hypothetical protein
VIILFDEINARVFSASIPRLHRKDCAYAFSRIVDDIPSHFKSYWTLFVVDSRSRNPLKRSARSRGFWFPPTSPGLAIAAAAKRVEVSNQTIFRLPPRLSTS